MRHLTTEEWLGVGFAVVVVLVFFLIGLFFNAFSQVNTTSQPAPSEASGA